MSDYEDPPRTFPGAGWYEPEVAAAASITTLELPDDERELAAIREAEQARKARGIGFAPPRGL
jgi:hypothetical protein